MGERGLMASESRRSICRHLLGVGTNITLEGVALSTRPHQACLPIWEQPRRFFFHNSRLFLFRSLTVVVAKSKSVIQLTLSYVRVNDFIFSSIFMEHSAVGLRSFSWLQRYQTVPLNVVKEWGVANAHTINSAYPNDSQTIQDFCELHSYPLLYLSSCLLKAKWNEET